MKKNFYSRFMAVLTLAFVFTCFTQAQETLNIPIDRSIDDAEEFLATSIDRPDEKIVGGVSRTSSDLEMVWDDAPQIIGLVFRNVTVEPGSVISSAHIQFVADDDGDEALPGPLNIYGVAVSHIDSITGEDFSISGLAKTSATVSWNADPWVNEFDSLDAQKTPDISALISEVISLEGWESGNNIGIVIMGTGTETEDIIRRAKTYDDSTTLAPVLTLVNEGVNALEAVNSEAAFVVYPTVFSESLTILSNEINSVQKTVTLLNAQGQIVLTRSFNGESTYLPVEGITEGMYYVKVSSGSESFVQKVVKY